MQWQSWGILPFGHRSTVFAMLFYRFGLALPCFVDVVVAFVSRSGWENASVITKTVLSFGFRKIKGFTKLETLSVQVFSDAKASRGEVVCQVGFKHGPRLAEKCQGAQDEHKTVSTWLWSVRRYLERGRRHTYVRNVT